MDLINFLMRFIYATNHRIYVNTVFFLTLLLRLHVVIFK